VLHWRLSDAVILSARDLSSTGIAIGQNSVTMKLVPTGATIAELEKRAIDCEEKAKKAAEPEATKLREEALLYREWITALRSGKWHA
jgi:serine acetyltransferase